MQSESKKCHNNQLIRSFGRIKSRKLSDHKNNLLDNSLSKYEISDDFFKEIGDFKSKSFEIGFGFGDFLYQKAKNNQNQLFLGCEPHINGVVALLGHLEKEPLSNLKISLKDARLLLDERFDGFFDEFYILFPDPWPKSRHFKRRLINQDFLDNFVAKKLKKGAKLTIATDHDSYKTWILSAILKSEEFAWQCHSKADWQSFPDDWVETKYQKKAAKEGRNSIIFQLLRK